MRISILGYACESALGSTSDYWSALVSGKAPTTFTWPDAQPLEKESSQTLLVRKLLSAWREVQKNLRLAENLRIGVIFASTKGNVDDVVWDVDHSALANQEDTLVPVLREWIKNSEMNVTESICVSNACASSLSAVFLASEWLRQSRVDRVILLAADRIGPFVDRGFKSLQAVSPSIPKPFSAERDGLRLGDAAAVLVMGKVGDTLSKFEIESVGIDEEGFAVTRPSPSGESLKRAFQRAYLGESPDLILAHGTGTVMNDIAEDQAFRTLFPDAKIPITGTKWCIGHTLGASGAMDLIAAGEVLRTQKVFSLATTETIDPKFQGNYLTAKNTAPAKMSRILISSLGFGGIHAVAFVSLPKFSSPSLPAEKPADETAITVKHLFATYPFPSLQEPKWSTKVDRWYQLDGPAFALSEFFETHQTELGPLPTMMILASPSASNETDLQFAESTRNSAHHSNGSPGKFVHTLPNIRVSPLCQIMGWTGPVLCLQKGHETVAAALAEAKGLLTPQNRRIWMWTVSEQKNANQVDCCVFEYSGVKK